MKKTEHLSKKCFCENTFYYAKEMILNNKIIKIEKSVKNSEIYCLV